MFIDIKPTTTLAALTQNNTSAADSFPGWINGTAKAGNVSRMPLDVPQDVYGHRCDWWGFGNHPDIGIHCTDAAYCAKTAVDMKARGLKGALLDWYGEGSNEDKSLIALKPALEAAGLRFGLCVDGGSKAIKAATDDAGRTAALLKMLAYARPAYLSASSYLKVNGKPVVLFFGFSTADFNWPQIRTALADCLLIFRWELNYSNRSYADGYFGWTHCDETWVGDVKKRAPGKLIFLGINGGFDSSHKEDPIRCSWGSGNIIKQNGGLTLQNQLDLARKHPEILLASLNTWNDYQEGSALEPGLASGVTITLAMSSGVLNWNGGPMFAHYDVLVSADGQNFMPLSRSDIPMLVDLDGLEFKPGSYWFAISATGKPFVQNAVSNVIKANLAWA